MTLFEDLLGIRVLLNLDEARSGSRHYFNPSSAREDSENIPLPDLPDILKTYNNRAMRLLREECRHESWTNYESDGDDSVPESQRMNEERCYSCLGSDLYLCFADGKIGSQLRLLRAPLNPMSYKVPDMLLTDGQCRMMINTEIQFHSGVSWNANGLAAGKGPSV